MGQQQAQTNNNIIPNKTLVTASPNEKTNFDTAATKRPLALNGRSEQSKHNSEIPVETEFSNLLRPTAGKQRILSYRSYHYPRQWRSSFLNKGGRGNHVVHGIMG
jgi:hypothetical protein